MIRFGNGCSLATLLIAILALTAGGLVYGKKLYKFRDETGTWHFSDTPPDTDQPVEVKQLRVTEMARKVFVRARGARNRPILHIINSYSGPVEVEIDLSGARNVTTEPPLPARFVVPAVSDVPSVRLLAMQQGVRWSGTYSYRSVPGDPKAKHQPPNPYLPPIPPGRSFMISQGFHGKFTHHHPQSEYAVDIATPEGTEIHAARAGVVMDVANDFIAGGTEDKYASRANLVRIVHDDGTMAIYGHLKLESARVLPGMRVAAGQVIAESGNTGYSSGPHLHFAVQRNAGMALKSIPFTFEANGGRGVVPKQGMTLEVKNPDPTTSSAGAMKGRSIQ